MNRTTKNQRLAVQHTFPPFFPFSLSLSRVERRERIPIMALWVSAPAVKNRAVKSCGSDRLGGQRRKASTPQKLN